MTSVPGDPELVPAEAEVLEWRTDLLRRPLKKRMTIILIS